MVGWLDNTLFLNDCQWTMQMDMAPAEGKDLLLAVRKCITDKVTTSSGMFTMLYGELFVGMLTIVYYETEFVIPITEGLHKAIMSSLSNIEIKLKQREDEK